MSQRVLWSVASVVVKRLLDNTAGEERVFQQGSAFLLLALVKKKDQIRNEKELIAFGICPYTLGCIS